MQVFLLDEEPWFNVSRLSREAVLSMLGKYNIGCSFVCDTDHE